MPLSTRSRPCTNFHDLENLHDADETENLEFLHGSRQPAPRGSGKHCHCCRQKRVQSHLIPCGASQGEGGPRHGPWCHRCILTKLHRSALFIASATREAKRGVWKCPRCEDVCPCNKCTYRRIRKSEGRRLSSVENIEENSMEEPRVESKTNCLMPKTLLYFDYREKCDPDAFEGAVILNGIRSGYEEASSSRKETRSFKSSERCFVDSTMTVEMQNQSEESSRKLKEKNRESEGEEERETEQGGEGNKGVEADKGDEQEDSQERDEREERDNGNKVEVGDYGDNGDTETEGKQGEVREEVEACVINEKEEEIVETAEELDNKFISLGGKSTELENNVMRGEFSSMAACPPVHVPPTYSYGGTPSVESFQPLSGKNASSSEQMDKSSGGELGAGKREIALEDRESKPVVESKRRRKDVFEQLEILSQKFFPISASEDKSGTATKATSSPNIGKSVLLKPRVPWKESLEEKVEIDFWEQEASCGQGISENVSGRGNEVQWPVTPQRLHQWSNLRRSFPELEGQTLPSVNANSDSAMNSKHAMNGRVGKLLFDMQMPERTEFEEVVDLFAHKEDKTPNDRTNGEPSLQETPSKSSKPGPFEREAAAHATSVVRASKYFTTPSAGKHTFRKQEQWVPPVSPFGLIQEYLYEDPWRVLVACILLNKTGGPQMHKVIWDLFELIPTAEMAAVADPTEIMAIVRPLGLQNKRALIIKKLSKAYVNHDWTDVLQLPGIGKYASDAHAIFCEGRWKEVHPDDYMLKNYVQWLRDTDGLGMGFSQT